MSVTLVTGAAGGIGSAIAARLVERGDTVVLLDRDGAAVGTAADRLNAQGVSGVAHGWELDVASDEQNRDAVRRAVSELGGLDCIVNNAGVGQSEAFGELTYPEWQRLMDVNLWGVASLCQAAASHWKERPGGSIVNMSSRVWVAGGPLAYVSSKAAVVGLTRSLAVELGPYRVRVNAVAPGTVLSPLVAAAHGDQLEAHLEVARSISHLPDLPTPENVADLVAFLSSEASSCITGEVIHVCGGAQLAPMAYLKH